MSLIRRGSGLYVPHQGIALVRGSGVTREIGAAAPATRGPEIAPSLTDGAWTTGLPGGFSQDGSGLHFLNTNGGTAAHSIVTEDNATYEIIYTMVYTSGSFRWQLYGATSAHLGTTTARTASGTYTEQVTTNSAGSFSLTVRANPNGANGTNTMNITALSIKKVLA